MFSFLSRARSIRAAIVMVEHGTHHASMMVAGLVVWLQCADGEARRPLRHRLSNGRVAIAVSSSARPPDRRSASRVQRHGSSWA
jgi:hypothetical protein